MSNAVHFPAEATARISRPFRFVDHKMYGATGGYHMGVDLVAALGSPIYAAAAGDVIEAGYKQKGGYGRRVIIQHEGFKTLYAHLHTVLVEVGEAVEAGQQLGTMGGNVEDPYRGASGGTHLHFEVILPKPPKLEKTVHTYNGWCVDPLPFLAAHFLPEASYRGTVIVTDGVRVRVGASTRAAQVYALPYWARVEFLDAQKIGANTWGRLRSIREEWAAIEWRGHRLIEMEAEAESGMAEKDDGNEAIAARLEEISAHLEDTIAWLQQQRAWVDAERRRLNG